MITSQFDRKQLRHPASGRSCVANSVATLRTSLLYKAHAALLNLARTLQEVIETLHTQSWVYLALLSVPVSFCWMVLLSLIRAVVASSTVLAGSSGGATPTNSLAVGVGAALPKKLLALSPRVCGR